MHWLVHDGLYCWLQEQVLDWCDSLELRRLADGPGGEERLLTYQGMRRASAVFPWADVAHDIRRRVPETHVTRQVYVKVDKSAKYGFVLRQPGGSFDWKPDASWVMPPEVVGRGSWTGGRSSRYRARARSRSRSCSRSPTREARPVGQRGHPESAPVAAGSGIREPIWPPEWARVGAVALIGSDRVASVAGRLVPRGATVGAMAITWSRQTGELEDVLRRVSGMTESEAVESLIRTVSRLTDERRIHDGILAELQNAP